MKVFLSAAAACLLAVNARCQDPVAAVLKKAQLSTIPGVYQSVVTPGSLLILREKGKTVAFEDASDMADGFANPTPPKPAATITLGKTALVNATSVSVTLKLFGYDPGAAFGLNTQVTYDQAVFTGNLISGKQMEKLIKTDQDTIDNIHVWLLRGYHVYLVEGVFATPKLNVTATKVGGGVLSSGGSIEPCSTTPPTIPTTSAGASDTNTSGSAPATDSSPKKTAAAAAASGTPDDDGTQTSAAAATSVNVQAKICHGTGSSYTLDSPTPVNLAVKLEELHYFADPTDHSKSIVSYVPVTVSF